MSRACANCRRTLGELETAYWWGEHAVCLPCYQSLSQQHVGAVSNALHADAAVEAADHVDLSAPGQADYGSGLCASCGGEFPLQEMTIDEAGQQVCGPCEMAAAARRAQAKTARRSAAAVSAYKSRPVKKKSSAVPWTVAATVAALAGGGAWYYFGRTPPAPVKPVASATRDPIPSGPPTPQIPWEARERQFVLEGNSLEKVGKLAAAAEQWRHALAEFPEANLTPEQAARRDLIRGNIAKLEERAARGMAKASEKRGLWGFGGPYVAYTRSAPDVAIPAPGTAKLFDVPKVTTAPATAPSSDKPKTEMASADGDKMRDKGLPEMMDKSPDKSMDKGMDKSMSKGMDSSMEGDMAGPKRSSKSGESASAKSDKPSAATSQPGSDTGQQLFGNVASKLGMNSRRGKAAAAAAPDVKLTDEQQAMLLLDEGQAEEAQKAFEAIVEKNPSSVLAHDALGCLEMLNNRRPEATAHFEKAVSLKPGDRVAAINTAALALQENPERAARLLRAYLAAGGPLDEAAQNAFGTALTHCTGKSQDRAYLLESRDFYLRYDARLNQARADGQKRWGSQWVDAATADTKWALLLGPGYALEKAQQDYPKLSDARKQAFEAWQRVSRNVATAGQVELAKQHFDAASKAEEDLVERIRQFDSELDKAEQPKFPNAIEMVLPQ